MAKDNKSVALDPIVREAQDRFEWCRDWESKAQNNYVEDQKFANADAENMYQWDARVLQQRNDRPCLTVNKTRQHNLAIVNDAKENKPAIKVMPTGGGATLASAEVYSALIRRIEAQSQAPDLYSGAMRLMVDGGFSYMRVVTKYMDPKSFDQDVYLEGIANSLNVYLDPDAKLPDKSDAKFGFVFDDKNPEEFKKRYPKYAKYVVESDITFGNTRWMCRDNVRLCEYYRVVAQDMELYATQYDPGNPGVATDEVQFFTSEELKAMRPELAKAIKTHPSTKSRPVQKDVVEWKLIIGNRVVEENIWIGDDIPIVLWCAEETIIENKMDRISHTRSMRDPQRIYNYWTSTSVEYGALQTKVPWTAPIQAIEGYETFWDTANTENHSYLPYNAFDENGQPLPQPQRVPPPVSSPVALDGVKLAAAELEMVSGQYAPAMGQESNERTGRAINARQRMGDRATYHYIDAEGRALRRIGRILLQIIPRVYDTKRALMVMAEDATVVEIQVDPTAQAAFQVEQAKNLEGAQRIFNPAMGKYDVVADVGPGYATRREEAFNAFTLILTQAPQLAGVIGDLMLRAGDFPLSDEAAQRLKRMVPPQALGVGPSQNEQMLMQEVQQLRQLLQKLSDEYARERLRSNSRAELRDIDAYKAITDRVKVVGDQLQDAHAASMALTQLELDLAQNNLAPVEQKAERDMGYTDGALQGEGPMAPSGTELPFPRPTPEIPGAQKAPDGHYYLKDPNRPGRYMRVIPMPQDPHMRPGGGLNNA